MPKLAMAGVCASVDWNVDSPHRIVHCASGLRSTKASRKMPFSTSSWIEITLLSASEIIYMFFILVIIEG